MTIKRGVQIHGGHAVSVLSSGGVGWLIVDIEDTPARQETLTVFMSAADMRRIAQRLLRVADDLDAPKDGNRVVDRTGVSHD